MSGVLDRLIHELNAGALQVIDLSRPLGPESAVIELPPPFAP